MKSVKNSAGTLFHQRCVDASAKGQNESVLEH